MRFTMTKKNLPEKNYQLRELIREAAKTHWAYEKIG